jgi:hypothetical protein
MAGHTHTDRETGDLIILLSFLKSRLKSTKQLYLNVHTVTQFNVLSVCAPQYVMFFLYTSFVQVIRARRNTGKCVIMRLFPPVHSQDSVSKLQIDVNKYGIRSLH